MGFIKDLNWQINKLLYHNKLKKLNIEENLLSYIAYRLDEKCYKDFLKVLSSSKDSDTFEEKLLDYIQENEKKLGFVSMNLLVGNITGYYNIVSSTITYKKPNINYDHFKYSDEENAIIMENAKNFFIEYINNDNKLKNEFLHDEEKSNLYNFRLDLDQDKIMSMFFYYTNQNDKFNSKDYEIINNYIFNLFNDYSKEDLINNFDFVMYDMLNGDKKLPMEERRQEYELYKGLTDSQVKEIKNISKLREQLSSIKNSDATQLLARLDSVVDDPKENISELEDIYLEYETCFREDIIEHLYIPTENITIIEDFRDLQPQLLHCFIRDPSKLENTVIEQEKRKIIESRLQKNSDPNLTEEELQELEKRQSLIDVQLDQTQVNYSFDLSRAVYSDPSGFINYRANTENNLSASIFSEDYFLQHDKPIIGVGFNREGIIPESIALSSPQYITANKGLYNLELSDEFSQTMSSYETLKMNDGKSEIVLFRRGMDFDTKASYVFVACTDLESDIVKRAKALADKNNMKLVIYDLPKIQNSYRKYLDEQQSNIDMVSGNFDNYEKEEPNRKKQ